MWRQHKQTADKHHLSPEKVKEISLIDAKKSRFGAENLTKCGNFNNCLTICIWFNIAVSEEYLVQRFCLTKSESLVYLHFLHTVTSVHHPIKVGKLLPLGLKGCVSQSKGLVSHHHPLGVKWYVSDPQG